MDFSDTDLSTSALDDAASNDSALGDTGLSDTELRVLGCLIEKAMTTPDYYPLTLNALITACNQRSNRSPVVDYDDATVIRAIDALRDRGWTRLVRSPGQRAVKYKQVIGDIVGLDESQQALLAVLMLRGEQTPGELRARTTRYVDFDHLDQVEAVLATLEERDFVRRLERRPGEKESRYRQLLGASQDDPGRTDQSGATGDDLHLADRVEYLEAEVERLSNELDALRAALGGE